MARYKIHYSIQLVHVLHCNILFILIHTNNTNRNRRNKNWKCKLNVTLKVTTYIIMKTVRNSFNTIIYTFKKRQIR